MAALDTQIAVLMAARARMVQGPSMGAAASSAKRAMEDAAETGPHVPGHTREPWCFFGGRAWVTPVCTMACARVCFSDLVNRYVRTCDR